MLPTARLGRGSGAAARGGCSSMNAKHRSGDRCVYSARSSSAGVGVRVPRRRGAVRLSIIHELQGEVEVLAPQQRDDGLQVVLLLGRDAQFLALDLGLDAARPLVPDDLRD